MVSTDRNSQYLEMHQCPLYASCKETAIFMRTSNNICIGGHCSDANAVSSNTDIPSKEHPAGSGTLDKDALRTFKEMIDMCWCPARFQRPIAYV